MLFWSNSRSAPSDESRSDARARSRRSERSRAKSIRCSQSTAMVAPREAMFMDALLLVGGDETAASVHEYRTFVRRVGVAAERSRLAGRSTLPTAKPRVQPIARHRARLTGHSAGPTSDHRPRIVITPCERTAGALGSPPL